MKAIAKQALKRLNNLLDRLRYASVYTSVHGNLDWETHVREAAGWLVRAQDTGSDRGIAYGVDFKTGYRPSYPETTGYIIPTFYALGDYYGDASYYRRAVEAGDWEIEVQLASGAVRGGAYYPENPDPAPAVFNTGMVLIGWAELLRRTGEQRYREAGLRAARWLIEMQDADGRWLRGNSKHANPETTVYNVKSAWGLCLFGAAAGDQASIDAAVRNAEFAMKAQKQNGWFENCCLDDAARPLLHTIAYTMEGLVGIGRITGRQDFISATRKCADALIGLMDGQGYIPGRIGPDFRGAVEWCCLTGSAQTGEVWGQLHEITGEPRYLEALRRVNRYLMARHDIRSPDPAIRGAVAGSWPVWGDYMRLRAPNWAAKFFLDSLLAERRAAGRETESA